MVSTLTLGVQEGSHASRLNWLRAGVLGANDGIISTAALVLGVAGATGNRTAVLTAGVVGLLAGAMSMAVGEYVSVSAQRDGERAIIGQQVRALADQPDAELAKLASVYQDKGLSPALAAQVANELSDHDPLVAHVDARLNIDPDELTNPWHAGIASFVAFVLGAAIPLLGIVLGFATLGTSALVGAALAITGVTSAVLGSAPIARAVWRNVGGGVLAMSITYVLGTIAGVTIL